MPYRQHTLDNAADVLAAVRAELGRPSPPLASATLLAPTPTAAARLRRLLADGPCALGARVEGIDAWVADRWELFGDGRRIVDAGERELLVRRACREVALAGGEGAVLEPTPGTVDILARLAREALADLLDVGEARSAEAGLSPSERGVLQVLERYAAQIGEAGLCESSQACALLPAMLPDAPRLVLAGFDDMGPAHERLVAGLSARGDVVRFDDGCRAPDADPERSGELRALLGRLFSPGGEPLAPTGAVRFLLPAGRYAAPPLVARAVAALVARERKAARDEGRPPLPVVVSARDPRALFDEVAGELLAQGTTCGTSSRRMFADTAFGRAFLTLLALAFDESYEEAQASDFVLSAFSGMSWRTACELDASWRGDRTADRKRIVCDLSAASEPAAAAFAALSRGDADGALSGFEARVRRRTDLDPAFRVEQLAAVSAARAFAAACARLGIPLLDERALLVRASVSAGARTAAADAAPAPAQPDALFMTLSEAAELPSCSCAALVLCDLTAGSYPVRVTEDGGALLLEKLGIGRPADALADARRRFFRALSCARDEVVCERALNSADADEEYPAVVLEELLDCYRPGGAGGPAAGDGADDRATGLPASLVPFAETAGEEALHANLSTACGCGGRFRAPLEWDVPAAGEVSEARRPRIVLPAPNAPESAAPALSPSAVETYLECPYKWFALRRLRTSEPDAEFGPKEKGSFSHAVLKSFYERFRAARFLKAAPENLPAAHEALDAAFDERLAAQPTLRPKDNPLIARTKLEEAEVDDLRRKLAAFVDREARFLPGFAPTFLEHGFGVSEPFEYAGCLLRGSVDRIDVNEHGQAVVIDYKGSLSPDYALASASPAAQADGALLPHKVQTLMYAQVARRLLGLDVVGALYVSYAKPKVAGAADRTVLGEALVPGLSIEACGVPGPAADALGAADFGQLVDLVEERIARAAGRLLAGSIAPDPRGSDPCGYCPVLACERRREKR